MHDTGLHSFLFADISGYARLTELDGDEAAADLALRLIADASEIAYAHGAELVKTLGDCVMIHAEDPAACIRVGLDLLARFQDDPALPDIHAGVHTGRAVRRGDDWWGATVNVAARVAQVAEAGQLLVTEPAMCAAGRLPPTEWRGMAPLRLKNILEPVGVVEAAPAPCVSVAA
jgi:adenylate cyclase